MAIGLDADWNRIDVGLGVDWAQEGGVYSRPGPGGLQSGREPREPRVAQKGVAGNRLMHWNRLMHSWRLGRARIPPFGPRGMGAYIITLVSQRLRTGRLRIVICHPLDAGNHTDRKAHADEPEGLSLQTH